MERRIIKLGEQEIILHVAEIPNGYPILALHGFGLSGEIFGYIEPYLTKAGFSLYAPDLPGLSSQQDMPVLEGGLKAYARWVHALLQALGLSRALLLGHSLGGRIALAAGVDYPEDFCGIILLNPGGFYLGEKILLFLSLEPVLWMLHLPGIHSLVRRTPLHPFISTPERRKTVRRYRKGHFGLDLLYSGYRRRLSSLQLPVLLLWGAEDNLLPRQVYHRIQKHLPQIEAQLIPGAGHFPAREQPARTAEAIANFGRKFCSSDPVIPSTH